LLIESTEAVLGPRKSLIRGKLEEARRLLVTSRQVPAAV
jgi:hypothetical protein